MQVATVWLSQFGWRLTRDGKVLSSQVEKSVIHVTERMNYADVTKILDRSDEAVLTRYAPYVAHFDRMKELAKI